ncbi:MAG: alpha/beta hydrolase [Acidimicrobiales bacterium]
MPRRRTILAPLSLAGSAAALLFWWQSLFPTQMPRTWVAQAAISAICLTIGYAIGVLAARVLMPLLRWLDAVPGPQHRSQARQTMLVVAALVVAVGAVVWPRWQNEQRELVDLGPISTLQTLPMLVLTVVLAVVLGLIGRVIGRGVVRLHRFNRRHLPGPLAQPATIVLVILIAGFLLRDVAFQRFVDSANTAFGTLDTTTSEGTEQPDATTVSGSPSSLVDWDSLGIQGRDFVAQATSLDDLRAFHGSSADVVDPVRVYVGLRTAPSPEERADLAVRELERTGASERSILVVTTATGTGWVDPDAAVAIEQMHAGDTAIVTIQYSYLPSWISSLVDQGNATEAGAVLFDTVHAWWSDLPADDRPQLVVFGQSLGSYGAEAAFAGPTGYTSLANMVARTDGALFTGPTHGNVVWGQLTAARDAGSPAWSPVIDEGRSVRFATRDPDAATLPGTWEHPRILYIQHPSDPVTFWGIDSMWSPPEWMDDPRGHDVPTRGDWFPVVTGVQGVFDLMAGFGAPPGFGHDYRLDFVRGWADVAPPDGWTSDDTRRLEDHLHR